MYSSHSMAAVIVSALLSTGADALREAALRPATAMAASCTSWTSSCDGRLRRRESFSEASEAARRSSAVVAAAPSGASGSTRGREREGGGGARLAQHVFGLKWAQLALAQSSSVRRTHRLTLVHIGPLVSFSGCCAADRMRRETIGSPSKE